MHDKVGCNNPINNTFHTTVWHNMKLIKNKTLGVFTSGQEIKPTDQFRVNKHPEAVPTTPMLVRVHFAFY